MEHESIKTARHATWRKSAVSISHTFNTTRKAPALPNFFADSRISQWPELQSSNSSPHKVQYSETSIAYWGLRDAFSLHLMIPGTSILGRRQSMYVHTPSPSLSLDVSGTDTLRFRYSDRPSSQGQVSHGPDPTQQRFRPAKSISEKKVFFYRKYHSPTSNSSRTTQIETSGARTIVSTRTYLWQKQKIYIYIYTNGGPEGKMFK